MKNNSNKRKINSFMAGLLVFAMIVTSVLPGFPSMQAKAAGVKWLYVKAGENNGNSHNYETAAQKPAAVLLNQSATMPLNGQISTKVRFTNENPADDARFAVFYTYQDPTHWIYVGYDKQSQWYYQYKNGSEESYPKLSFAPSVPIPEAGKEYEISVSLANEVLSVNITEGANEYVATSSAPALKTVAEIIDGKGKFGFRAAGGPQTEFMFCDVNYTGKTEAADEWAFLLPELGSVLEERTIETFDVSGKVTDETGKGFAGATVRFAGKSAVTDTEGNYRFSEIEGGTYEIAVSATGYQAVSKSVTISADSLVIETIQLQKEQEVVYDTFIESSEMKVAIDKAFPRVMQYELKTGDARGKTFHGQTNEIDKIKINGQDIVPTLKKFDKQADRAVYSLGLSSGTINLDMEVTVSVKENDLIWEITKITKGEGCAKINTIEVPKLNLVTIDDSQENTQFKGAVNSGNVAYSSSGDREITFSSGFRANETSTYGYGFISGNGLSAGLWSNSEAAGDRRVTRNNGSNTISLTSTAWYYEYGPADSANYEHTPVSEMPCVKVCIAPDLNDDGVADWQDGAIAYRDIMNNPYAAENVPELVNYRVVMNLGSEATNPFLMSADNIKKVYLATDGLGQAIMHKGYGSEGHDSANSEYGNIADKLGGADEFRKLIQIAHQYNTEVGIHVNAQEAYAEAQTFSDDLIYGPDSKGWNWMDQAYVIDKVKDLGNGLRYKRMLQLYDQINGTSLYANKWPGVAGQGSDETVADASVIADTVAKNIEDGTNMDFIYLDVWYQDSWETRKIAQQFNSLGWRFSTEFGTTGEYDSTWQHWATDAAYGASDSKGNNSEVMRFIRNHQKDSFVLNYPSFGGAADNPLLGHMYMNGFEGWGSNDSFVDYITNVYVENVPAKFLQHYLITKWVNYSGQNGDVSPAGNHEKEITLKSADGQDTVVVTRNNTRRSDSIIERTITLNGKKVLEDDAYLLPWIDSETDQEKLYHWNYDGGTTTWELQDDWKNLKNVVVYQLSDQGRGSGKSVAVTNGSITLEGEAQTAYIVLKGEEAPKALKADFGEFAKVTDPAFNNYAGTGDGTPLNGDVWSGDIEDESIRVKKMPQSGDQYLVIEDPSEDVAVSTQLYDLTPGQNYVAQIYVDNRSDVKAVIEVDNGEETVSNYTLKSIAENYIRADLHNTRAIPGSRMQIMLVSFKAVTDKATLTLRREAGAGYTHFDDIRIVAKSLNNFRKDGTFVQDFETVVQGLYPFVMGSGQGVDDPSTHLSEYHAPYTQSGWGNVIIDDVISGCWSLKQHDSYMRTGVVYRTIPQNFHFEPDKTYEVSFDYQAGATNGFYIVIGEGEGQNVTERLPYLENTTAGRGEKSWTNHYSFTLTGAKSGQSWFGLYNVPENQGSSSYGEYDFIMDNLVISEVESGKPTMQLDKNNISFNGVVGTQKIDATVTGENPVITYSSANTAIARVDNNGTVTPVAFGSTVITVTAKVGDTVLVNSVNVVVKQSGNVSYIDSVYANTQETSSESGGKDNTIDGNSSTLWHTNYSSQPFKVSDETPAILTYKLKAGADVDVVRFQQRASGGTNGIIKKYQFVWGTEFDEASHTVSGGGSSDIVTLSGNSIKNDAWINVDVSNLPANIGYLQIRILEGQGGFGAMAEFEAYKFDQYPGSAPEAGSVDKSELAAQMKNLANMNTFGLSVEDILEINAEIEEANKLLCSSEATAEMVKSQIDRINALKYELSDGKRIELETLYSEYIDTDTSEYSEAAVKAFNEALKVANVALQKDAASSFEIINAITSLKKAYAEMTGTEVPDVTVEKNALLKELGISATIKNAGQKNYTDATWSVFISAYNAAEKGKESQDAAELTKLTENLKKAREGLKEKAPVVNPDVTAEKEALNKALADALAIKNAGQKNYTDETWKAFISAFDAAEAGKNSVDAAALKKLKDALVDAQAKLTEKTLKKGQVYTDTKKKLQYKVTDAAKKTVTVVKGTKKNVTSVTIPATVTIDGVNCKVTEISAKAFKGFRKLRSVTIGSNVTKIGNSSFEGCAAMTKATIGSNVKTIGKKAFYKCKKLAKVTIKGKKITKIQANAFKGTSSKLKVTLPKKLTKKQKDKLNTLLKKAGA